ncbi:MAG TPA: response regulator transcription factor [Opitutaceae bacterium]|nr:response regulator transcription factor [Opitutaceae bacterium]
MSAERTRVAVVEDNPTTRESLETIIGLAPELECTATCATAEEALRRLPRLAPDVVMMDIHLPAMSGVDCAAELKAALPAVQIIMLTVYEDPDRIFAALRAGACGYLLKRSSPEQILGAIRDVQRGGVPMTGDIARKVIAQFRAPLTQAVELETLSPREREVLELVAQGFSNKDIASRLCISVDAIRWHLKNTYHKLHVNTRTQAALKLKGGA